MHTRNKLVKVPEQVVEFPNPLRKPKYSIFTTHNSECLETFCSIAQRTDLFKLALERLHRR